MPTDRTSGPAFPSHGSMGEVVESGISLRDYFAAAALSGIMANSQGQFESPWQEHAARDAYSLADAMLAEREKKA